MQWKPIETAPRDGTQFLGYDPEHYESKIYVLIWNEGYKSNEIIIRYPGFIEASGECYFEWDPTHWMPLPVPPKD